MNTPAPELLNSPSPELFGIPVAVLAFMVAGAGFVISLTALGWQIAKHVLDGGRVRVLLNAAVWELNFRLATNRSGRWELKSDVFHGAREYFELAQLVVENPGRTPVTVYSPGVVITGTSNKKHTITPRMFPLENYGSDTAITDNVVRIEPYDRVTFLLDYWSIVPGLLEKSGARGITIRGVVQVAGRRRPRRSSWRLRWRIPQGAWTAGGEAETISPHTVIWREFYRRFGSDDERPGKLSKGALGWVVEDAMRQFDEKPSREEFEEALRRIGEENGEKFYMVATNTYEAFGALERHEGHLREWQWWKPKSGAQAVDVSVDEGSGADGQN